MYQRCVRETCTFNRLRPPSWILRIGHHLGISCIEALYDFPQGWVHEFSRGGGGVCKHFLEEKLQCQGTHTQSSTLSLQDPGILKLGGANTVRKAAAPGHPPPPTHTQSGVLALQKEGWVHAGSDPSKSTHIPVHSFGTKLWLLHICFAITNTYSTLMKIGYNFRKTSHPNPHPNPNPSLNPN